MKTRYALGLSLLLGLLSAGQALADRFAVLMSTEFSDADNAQLNSEFWYDLILMYKTLVDDGFSHENIIVLYGSENDYPSSIDCFQNPYQDPITDLMITPQSIQDTFAYLNEIMTDEDMLFIWWMGHGRVDHIGRYYAKIVNETSRMWIPGDELASWFDSATHYYERVVSIMTCHAAGILDHLGGDETTVLTSSTKEEPSAAIVVCGHTHAAYNYYLTGALHSRTPCFECGPVDADSSRNGFVSFREAFDYVQPAWIRSHPQIRDAGRLARYTYFSAQPITVSPEGSGNSPTIQAAIDSSIEDNLLLLTNGTFNGPQNRNIDFLVCISANDAFDCYSISIN